MKKTLNNVCIATFVALAMAAPAFAQEDPVVTATTAAAADFQTKFLLVIGAISSAALLMAGVVMTYKWAKATFFS